MNIFDTWLLWSVVVSTSTDYHDMTSLEWFGLWKQQWCWSYGFDSLFSAVVGCGFGQRTLWPLGFWLTIALLSVSSKKKHNLGCGGSSVLWYAWGARHSGVAWLRDRPSALGHPHHGRSPPPRLDRRGSLQVHYSGSLIGMPITAYQCAQLSLEVSSLLSTLQDVTFRRRYITKHPSS